MKDHHIDDTDEMSTLAIEPRGDEEAESDRATPEPKDDEVPPSGALPPDPTGLGALA